MRFFLDKAIIRLVLTKVIIIDFFSAYDYIIPARGKEIVKTDIQIELPEGCYGRIAPRSGLAVKNFIDIGGNCIVLILFLTVLFIFTQR